MGTLRILCAHVIEEEPHSLHLGQLKMKNVKSWDLFVNAWFGAELQ